MLGVSPLNAVLTLLWDARYSLITSLLAGFGRAVAEVGAVIIVGGNIDHVTRVMITAIALETSKGDLALAMGLGIILVCLAIAVNILVSKDKHPTVKADLGQQFVDWVLSDEGQKAIASYKRNGQQLFFPNAGS